MDRPENVRAFFSDSHMNLNFDAAGQRFFNSIW